MKITASLASFGTLVLSFALMSSVLAAASLPVAGQSCSTPGSTMMDASKQSILACLLDQTNSSPSAYKWTLALTTTIPKCNIPGQILNYDGAGTFTCVTAP